MRQCLTMIGFMVLAFAAPAQAQYYYAQPQYAQPVYAQQYAQPQYVQPAQPYAQPQSYQQQQFQAKQQQMQRYAAPVHAAPRAQAQPSTPQMVVVQPQPASMGGGFIEAVFGGGGERQQGYAPLPHQQQQQQRQQYYGPPQVQYAPAQQVYASTGPVGRPGGDYAINPIYERQEVAYATKEAPGTIVIDTPNKFLYLVQGDGRALRYGIGVGRPGFTWAGTHNVTMKKEWPDWIPPKEMLERQPYLPRHMEGGPNNPLGARAMYLGSTLYRIHGSNEPWTIGTNVSSGCIRMRNADVEDLYERVKVGTKVVVM